MKKLLTTVAVLLFATVFAFAAGQSEKSSTPAEDEVITITWMRSENPSQPIDENNKVVQMVEKLLNVKIELQLVNSSDWSTKKSVLLASDDMPDVMMGVNIDDIRKYANTGMFLNLMDYQEEAKDFLEIAMAEDRREATRSYMIDGGLYGFQQLEYNRVDIGAMPAIRMDLLAEQNIPEPETWDELYAALLKIKEKHPEMYGFSTRNGTTYMLGQYAYQLGGGGYPTFSNSGMYYEPKTDKWIYGPADESFVNVITFFANAYKDGLLHPDYATMTQTTEFEKLSNGELMFVADNNQFLARRYNPTLKGIDENAYFDILKPMKSNNDTQRAMRYERDWTEFIVVSADTKYPAKVIEVINWFYTLEGIMASNFGEEGVDYTMVDGVPVVNPDLLARHQNDSDVFSGIQGELGAGQLGLGLYVDETLYTQVADPIMISNGQEIREWTAEGLIHYKKVDPYFTDAEQERVTTLKQNIENVFLNEIDHFINGSTPLSEWPTFVEKLKRQGVAELEQLYNDAYQRSLE